MAGTTAEKERIDANGRILLIPVFATSGSNYSLAEPTYLPKTVYDCSNPANANHCDDPFRYEQETDVGVGVTCAPVSGEIETLFFGSFNCLLAWSDRGTPSYQINYTYFRVKTSGSITFYPFPLVLDGAQSVSDLSAAWFSDAFHLAWKDQSFPVGVRKAINDTATLTGWTVDSNVYGDDVVDPPTFLYQPASSIREAALVWTEAR